MIKIFNSLLYILTDVSEVLTLTIFTVIIALMMQAVGTPETSVNIYQITRCNMPEDSHLHNLRREILKSHVFNFISRFLLLLHLALLL